MPPQASNERRQPPRPFPAGRKGRRGLGGRDIRMSERASETEIGSAAGRLEACGYSVRVSPRGAGTVIGATRNGKARTEPQSFRSMPGVETVDESAPPYLLKRAPCGTINEWLLAAEYILSAGNPQAILCERGINPAMLESVGTTELLVVLAVGLIVFGPRKLPQLGRSFGQTVSQFRRASDDFKRTWEAEADAVVDTATSPAGTSKAKYLTSSLSRRFVSLLFFYQPRGHSDSLFLNSCSRQAPQIFYGEACDSGRDESISGVEAASISRTTPS